MARIHNSGLVNSSGGAYLTIQRAINVVAANLDLNGFQVTIQCAIGTYNDFITVNFKNVVGYSQPGDLTLQGSPSISTPGTAVTITNASPAVVTWTSHGRAADDAVMFAVSAAGSLPTGLTAGTIYYVIAAGLATNTFQVSATKGGSAINTSSAGSGTFYGFWTPNVEYVITSTLIDVLASNITSVWRIKGFRLGSASSFLLKADTGATIQFQDIDFAATPTHITADNAQILMYAGGGGASDLTYQISAGTINHIDCANGGYVNVNNAIVNFRGNCAFSKYANCGLNATINAYTGGSQSFNYWTGGTITGTFTVTGTRYNVEYGGGIHTAGGGANYFPGSIAGTTATGTGNNYV